MLLALPRASLGRQHTSQNMLSGLQISNSITLSRDSPGPRVSCSYPPKSPPGAALVVLFLLASFPEGTVLEYNCVRKYKRVPGTSNAIQCGKDGQWSKPDDGFCKESCDNPPVIKFATLQEEFTKLSYFPPGSVVKYDCIPGHDRIQGTENSIRCTDRLTWSDPQRFCEGTCPPPPKMTTAKLKKEYEGIKKFVVYMRVQYECKEGYKPIPFPGEPDIAICLNNWKWTGPIEFCELSCPSPPNIKNAKLEEQFAQLSYFPVGTVVKYECVGQYKPLPHSKNSIICGKNYQWSPLEVFCKESCPLPPSLSYAKLKRTFEGSIFFPVGTIVTYDCKEGYKRIHSIGNSIRCGNNLQWSHIGVFCKESCDFPPNLRGAKFKKEFEDLKYFPPGTVVKYECDRGFTHIPGTEDSVRCSDEKKWSELEVFCKEVICDDPVIEHGVKISGFRDTHMYGNNIVFECNIGYYMIGSYLIHCGENSMWNPGVPSCEKITAKLCGAPLVPSASFYPLEPQYKLGTYVVIECNPQYSFPDETVQMTTICQGRNLWKPPAQPCMFRTSPDTTQLTIHNGMIIHGKKNKYIPGDNVTIRCHAGFMLKGPSAIRYIGGKKWSPGIPYCSLSIFFQLLITGKRVRQKYSEQRESDRRP